MKWVFYFLLAANVGFGLFVYLRESAPNPDAHLAGAQMNADQIRVVPPREKPQAPALPAPQPAPASACLEWGGFAGNDVSRAGAALERLALGERLRRREVSTTVGHWVYIPPLKSKSDMDRKAAELKALGITDYYLVSDPARWRYAISLGVFRSEDGAKKYLAQMRGKGVRSAVTGSREQRVLQTAFLVSEPTADESAQLVTLKDEFPGSELRAVECPNP